MFSSLTASEIDDTFTIFPPFYTDCGKNIRIGKNVFINSGCCFQDQGGIEIGDGSLIGHQVAGAARVNDRRAHKNRQKRVDRLACHGAFGC